MAKRKKPAAASSPITERAAEPALDPRYLTPDDALAAFVGGATSALRQLEFWNRFAQRLQTYRRLYPDRYAHAVAFTENNSDTPTAEEQEKILAKAREIFGE